MLSRVICIHYAVYFASRLFILSLLVFCSCSSQTQSTIKNKLRGELSTQTAGRQCRINKQAKSLLVF